jgi:peroxiredoxin
MKKMFTAFTLFISITSQAQNSKPSPSNLIINATIKDLPAGSFVYWRKMGDNDFDSVKTEAGGFHIHTNIPPGEGNSYILRLGAKYTEAAMLLLYLDKGVVNITGDGPQFKDAKLSGSPFIQEFTAYNDFLSKDPQLANIKELYQQANDLYKKNDTTGLAKLQPQLDAVDSIRTALSKTWVKQHPVSPISAYVLYFHLKRNLKFDELETALNTLSPVAKDNGPAKELAHSIAVNKLTGIGQTALDFTQTDTAGKPISLHDFKGKYVLVDFWASWCHPCREENPNVVKAFSKYKDRNFTVLSVSLDQPTGKDKWLKAIHDDHLTWSHVSDLKFWSNAVAKLYDIGSIPSNLLIGPDGKIVAKDLHGDELDKKLSEILQN